MRILIVDDDYTSQLRLQALLEPYGESAVASDGETAFDLFIEAHESSAPFDLVTMDVNMPGVSGQDVVEKIRQWEDENTIYKSDVEIKVVMISSSGSSSDVVSSFSTGCEGYLVKPVSAEKLKIVLQKLGIKAEKESIS